MWGERDVEDYFAWIAGADDETFVIRFTRDGNLHRQGIGLTWTPCNFGGERSWFECPGCGRRVGKVYLPCSVYFRGVRVHSFLCRGCYGLTYLQRQERNLAWTMRYRADRLEERYFGEVTDDFIFKRKGQHWTTFDKRYHQYRETTAREYRATIARFPPFL